MHIKHPLIIDGAEIADEALAIIAAMNEHLSARVALQDLQRREAHVRMTDIWMCFPSPRDEVPVGLRDPDGETVSAPINWRWKLWAAPQAHFPADAFDVVLDTARKLADLLPAEKMPEIVAPPPGGAAGGSSGPAEFGIPVEWARKARDN